MISNEGTDGTSTLNTVLDAGRAVVKVTGPLTANAVVGLPGVDLEALPTAELEALVQALAKFALMMRMAVATPEGMQQAADGLTALHDSVRTDTLAALDRLRVDDALGGVSDATKERIGRALEVPFAPAD